MIPQAMSFIPGQPVLPQSVRLGLSLCLFTTVFLPTLLTMLAVIVFFIFYYPRLRKAGSERIYV